MPNDLPRMLSTLDAAALQALYGRWDPMRPAEVAELPGFANVRWHIAGGRAARAGAEPRQHEDTDVVVRFDDLDDVRQALAGWHLWEAHDGVLRPLLPGLPLTEGCENLWVRRDASQRWRLDLLLDRSSNDEQWVFKRDASVRLPWDRVLRAVDGVAYLRPELALLYKARLDRPKDRADLSAAALEPESLEWLTDTLDRLGYRAWAQLVRANRRANGAPGSDGQPHSALPGG